MQYSIGDSTAFGTIVGYEFFPLCEDIIETRSQSKAEQLYKEYPDHWRYIIQPEDTYYENNQVELYYFRHEVEQ